MSIISENKKTVKAAQKVYTDQRKIRDKAAYETAKKRKESQNLRYTTLLQEKEAIKELLALDTGEGMTAAEIARATNGNFSRHEIAGNLTAVKNGKSRYNIDRNKIRTEERRVVKHFIPCDENGRPLENAEPIKKETKINVYRFSNAPSNPTIGGEMVRQMFKHYKENNQ